jgi:hypothetical protein
MANRMPKRAALLERLAGRAMPVAYWLRRFARHSVKATWSSLPRRNAAVHPAISSAGCSQFSKAPSPFRRSRIQMRSTEQPPDWRLQADDYKIPVSVQDPPRGAVCRWLAKPATSPYNSGVVEPTCSVPAGWLTTGPAWGLSHCWRLLASLGAVGLAALPRPAVPSLLAAHQRAEHLQIPNSRGQFRDTAVTVAACQLEAPVQSAGPICPPHHWIIGETRNGQEPWKCLRCGAEKQQPTMAEPEHSQRFAGWQSRKRTPHEQDQEQLPS